MVNARFFHALPMQETEQQQQWLATLIEFLLFVSALFCHSPLIYAPLPMRRNAPPPPLPLPLPSPPLRSFVNLAPEH